jgi:hypothetical protein
MRLEEESLPRHPPKKMKIIATFPILFAAMASMASSPIEINNRRELFVDRHLIESTEQVELVLHEPRDEGVAFYFDKPWEGLFCGFTTIIRDGRMIRAYYRGKPKLGPDGRGEVTCVAESLDGVHWTKPELGLIEHSGSKANNIILAQDNICHNFSPFLDTNEKNSAATRYKALAGVSNMVGEKAFPKPVPEAGLIAYGSPDGIVWHPLNNGSVVLKAEQVQKSAPRHFNVFDSQNVSFWSEAENTYLSYFRVHLVDPLPKGKRTIMRATSSDFVHWDHLELIEHPLEDQLYTNQTHAYFRAPHIYMSIAARYLPDRKATTYKEEVAAKGFNNDLSDVVLLTSRGGSQFDSIFSKAFLRPGIGRENWTSRTNYPALNVIQTGETEISLYLNQNYTQPTAHLRRYSLRLDGFASARANNNAGKLITKPLLFTGEKLALNFSTSAAGSVRVELQDADGIAYPGFSLDDGTELIGNEVDAIYAWKGGADVRALSGKAVRLCFEIKDADVFAFQFR